MRRASFFLILLLLFGLVASKDAEAQYAVYCTNCSDELTQSLEHATSLEQLQQIYTQVDQAIQQTTQQITLVSQSLQQYENMVKNTINLPDTIRTKVLGTFQKLSSLTQQLNLQQGDASGLSQIFKATYSDTSTISDLAKSTKDTMASAASTFDSLQKKWSDEVDRSHQAAFQESGMQINDLETQASDLEKQLTDLLTTPDGQMKALEAGNQLAALQLQEAQKLRTLLAVSVQASVQKSMKNEKNEQAAEDAWKSALSTDKIQNFTPSSDF